MIVQAPSIFLERGDAPSEAIFQQEGHERAGPDGSASEEVSFWDLLDVVNPLQHIPVVSSVYRHITGDEIGGMARLVGGLLFGGPIGLVSSAANLVVEGVTGKDVGEHVMAAIDPADPDPGSTQLAAAAARAASAYGEGSVTGAIAGSQLDFYDIENPR